MANGKYVGRVGALAVALGIGSAVTALPPVAWAEPGVTATDTGPSTPTPTKRPRTIPRSVVPKANSIASQGDSTTPTPTKHRPNGSSRVPSRQYGGHGRSQDDDATTDSSPTAWNGPPARTARTPSVRWRASQPSTNSVAGVAPAATPVTTLGPLLGSLPAGQSGKEPAAPADSPLLWTVLAFARRQFARQSEVFTTSDAGRGAASSSVAAPAAASSITGSADGPTVIGADGTVYQVTTVANGTQVSIIDGTGQVLSTSDVIAGRPNIYSNGVARPDGTLIIVTSNDRGNRSTVSAVDGQGGVTKIASFVGQPNSVRVGANGALYVGTFVPSIFSPVGAADSRLLRISPTNAVRPFAPNTRVVLAPDGAAYLVASQFGVTSLRAAGADGKTKTVLLPYERYPTLPVLGGDGRAYLAVDVRRALSDSNTRLYTFNGADATVRTLSGEFGGIAAAAAGVYVATSTSTGPAANPDVTTYLSKVTATTLDISAAIPGAIAGFQVTDAGTVYAPIRTTQSPTSVAIVASDGSVTTTTLPGALGTTGAFVQIAGDGPRGQDQGYFRYTANGVTSVAVVNPDGNIARTIPLPLNQDSNPVFFGPDGSAYLMTQTRNSGQVASAQQLVSLSTGAVGSSVPGPPFSIPGIQFGSDGTGYLVTQEAGTSALQILGFDAGGLNGVSQSLTTPVIRDNGSFDTQALVFGPDGTAYATSYGPTDAGVYALTPAGATKVLDLDYAPQSVVYLPAVAANGTVYVTRSVFTGQTSVTTVTTIAPATTQ